MGALSAALGNITKQIISGEEFNVNELVENVIIGGVAGGFSPLASVSIISKSVGIDLVFTIIGGAISGAYQRNTGDDVSGMFIGDLFAMMSITAQGSSSNAIFKIISWKYTSVKLAYQEIKKAITKKELKDETIPVGRKIEMGDNPKDIIIIN